MKILPILTPENTNKCSAIALSTAFEAGATALVATIIANPIGILGGAALGATVHIAKLLLAKGSNYLFHADDPHASTGVKILHRAIAFFGAHGIAWAALALLNFPVLLMHVVMFGSVSVIASQVLGLAQEVLRVEKRLPPSSAFSDSNPVLPAVHVGALGFGAPLRVISGSDENEKKEPTTARRERSPRTPPPIVTSPRGLTPDTTHLPSVQKVVEKFDQAELKSQ